MVKTYNYLGGYMQIMNLIDVILHLDIYLNLWIALFGPGIYFILFLIIFAETGLIVFPFLPGDSLLFALGALTVTENAFLKLPYLIISLCIAAILGDAVNYTIGKFFGIKLFQNPKSRFFRREYLDRTHKFYEKHGGKTIILARFIPIVRTFAPFVAGMAEMKYRKFFLFNIVGALAWIVLFLLAGSVFGNLPSVKRNFHIVIIAIIVISVLPVVFEFIKARNEKKTG